MKKVFVIILVSTFANFANASMTLFVTGPGVTPTGGDNYQIVEGTIATVDVYSDAPVGGESGVLSLTNCPDAAVIDIVYSGSDPPVTIIEEECYATFGPCMNPNGCPNPVTAEVRVLGTETQTFEVELLDVDWELIYPLNFTIVGVPKVVTLLWPNGGQMLQADTAIPMTWSSSGSISNVKLEYSDDNGLDWDVIEASTPNDGQYDWVVPQVTSSQCLVRVSDASDAGVTDTSDGVFTIYVCQFDSAADSNNDCKSNMTDLSIISAGWSDVYDSNDLRILADGWLRNGNPFEAGFSEGPEGMVFIPNGQFEMGDHFGGGDDDELPLHTVYIDAFYMSKNETTNQQYCDYLNSTGQIKVVSGVVYAISDSNDNLPFLSTTSASSGAPNYSEYSQIDFSGVTFSPAVRDSQSMADHPVINVSWAGAEAYCDYYGLRLATEAEWEYAARGGAYYYKYPWGTDIINQTLANYNDGAFANPLGLSSFPYTSTAGYYGPQGGYGLSDMAGNVFELCSDWYDFGYYSSSPTNNPTGPASGTMRIYRGGSWGFDGTVCRVSYRGASAEIWGNTLGFRAVMDLN
jgi:formylglycine-generating enzyme required for sulfatase activity